ncbi:MAG: hypothetical protein QXJ64_03200 [Thermosphaera sp.]
MERDVLVAVLLALICFSPGIYIIYDNIVYHSIEPDIRVEFDVRNFPLVNQTNIISVKVTVSDLYNIITLSRRAHQVLIDVQTARGYIEILSQPFTKPIEVINTYSFNILIRGVTEGVDELIINAHLLHPSSSKNIIIRKTATAKLEIPVVRNLERLKPVDIYVYAVGQLFYVELYRRPGVADVYVCNVRAAFVKDNLYNIRVPDFIYDCFVEVYEPGTKRILYRIDSYAILNTMEIVIPDYRLDQGLLVLAGILLLPVTYISIKKRRKYALILILCSYMVLYALYNQSGPNPLMSFILPIYIISEIIIVYSKSNKFIGKNLMLKMLNFVEKKVKDITIKTTNLPPDNPIRTEVHGVNKMRQDQDKRKFISLTVEEWIDLLNKCFAEGKQLELPDNFFSESLRRPLRNLITAMLEIPPEKLKIVISNRYRYLLEVHTFLYTILKEKEKYTITPDSSTKEYIEGKGGIFSIFPTQVVGEETTNNTKKKTYRIKIGEQEYTIVREVVLENGRAKQISYMVSS